MTIAANSSGVVSGKFTIPAGIPSGSKQVVFQGAGGSRGSAVFDGQGTIERRTWQQLTTINTVRWQSPPLTIMSAPTGVDPLAQTFTLDANTQVSGVDLWFAAASTSATSIQIRQTTAGVPDRTIVAEVILQPGAIAAPGTHTRAAFASPVLLLGGVEYAIVVLCADAVGALSVAELGKFDATAQQWITSQPYTVGVLLSSSNASTWTAHQDRDLAFRLLSASYSETSRTINLGNIAVVGATDLMLMAYAERPASLAYADYILTLPDATQIVVADGQPVQLAAGITGNVGVQARLNGTGTMSPVLFPGAQFVAGQVGAEGTYVSRAFVAGAGGVTLKVIYEALVPSGASVVVQYKGGDVGDTWSAAIPVTATSAADDGRTEFVHTVTGVTEATVQIKITLSGSASARPRVRNLRAYAL